MKKDFKPTMAVEVIVDNSGSMCGIAGRVVDGLNQFMAELATAVTPMSVGITTFNESLRTTLVDSVPIYDLPKLTYRQYSPMGGEDIAFSVVQAMETRLAPTNAFQKVLVVVTDGLNSSPSMDKARNLIAKRRKEGWLVIWLGTFAAGYASYKSQMEAYAKGLGIPAGLTFCFNMGNFDKIMPLAARAALRFSGTGDETIAAFTREERGLA